MARDVCQLKVPDENCHCLPVAGEDAVHTAQGMTSIRGTKPVPGGVGNIYIWSIGHLVN